METPKKVFKAPRKQTMNNGKEYTWVEDDNTCSDTDDFGDEASMDEDIERYAKEEIGLWLATNGTKLFALECSKFMAKKKTTKDVRKSK